MAVEAISVPVIDLSNFPAERDKLVWASTELGCFRVVNHGIPPAMLAEMKAVVRALFEIPAEVKQRNADIIAGSGYMAPSLQNPLYEAFGLYDAASSADVRAFCNLLEASSYHKEIFSLYFTKLHVLIVDIASKVAESLGLVGYSFDDWPCQARINRYNFTEGTIGSSGVQIHTDSGFLTILQEDESVGGLEMMDSSGNFQAVDAVPGTFIVNLGDVAKIWSNGRLHNVKHRVQCKVAHPRISIALFMLAPKDGKVEPLAKFIDSEHPCLYQTIIYNEYRKLRLSSSERATGALHLLAVNQTATKA
ncbi:hypothetical protein HPP92_014983 [Vanilla planifolia]|uniref:2-oxoglutarate-dependent dioxygenase DAO n=1 Tax=Vanilla planifolia TaxID=51239 RepID=A0A835UVA2_VANPL|nr:hypothetical protein HPP92_014983 [Vanilla planifolia]